MKHAILIATHNNEDITRRLLKLYDDKNIDFYIHVDKKATSFQYKKLSDICEKSKVTFIDSINVYWGTFTQIQLELLLLSKAILKKYDYYHFISGVDIPLMTKHEFINFFEKHSGKEFVEFSPKEIALQNDIESRIKYYYFLMNSIRSQNPYIRKPQTFLRELLLKIQKKLDINRCKNIELYYGSNWFDITHQFAEYVLKQKKWIEHHFHHSCCADELFLQTILYHSDFYKNNYYNKNSSEREIHLGRYVDWERGNPYTFQNNDFNEVKNIKTSFFIRKFDYQSNSIIVNQIFNTLEERQGE